MVIEIVMNINEFREGEIKEGRSWEEWYEKELIGMGRFVYGLFRGKGIDAMRQINRELLVCCELLQRLLKKINTTVYLN